MEDNSFTVAVIVSLSSTEEEGGFPPPFPIVSLKLSCRTYHHIYRQSGKWRRLLSDFQVVPQVNEETSINIIYVRSFVRSFFLFSNFSGKEPSNKKTILLWYIGIELHIVVVYNNGYMAYEFL